MTAGWNDLPPEIRVMIIDNLDFISRAKLSACAKMEQQLVRSNPFKLDEIKIEKPWIYLKQKESLIDIKMKTIYRTKLYYKNKIILENQSPKETIKMIFKSLGTKCIVGKFTFYVERGFIDIFKWFRDNINFSTNSVYVCTNDDTCDDIEPFINWPKNVKISLDFGQRYAYRGPLFERLDKYDNINEFIYKVNKIDMTDTKLMKLSNCTKIKMCNSDITIDGFLWWLKQWLVRDDYTKLYFCASFYPRHAFIIVNEMKNGLGDFLIEAREERWKNDYGKERVYWQFTVRNKLNGRVEKILVDEASIRFEEDDY